VFVPVYPKTVACNCHKPHDACDFGLWWYAEVYLRRAEFSPKAQALIDTIDGVHRQFHDASAKIAELTAAGKSDEARKHETELMQHSNRLIRAILQLDDISFSS